MVRTQLAAVRRLHRPIRCGWRLRHHLLCHRRRNRDLRGQLPYLLIVVCGRLRGSGCRHQALYRNYPVYCKKVGPGHQ